MFTSTQIGWLKLADDLPRHAEGAPEEIKGWDHPVSECVAEGAALRLLMQCTAPAICDQG
jgi:hypothetical protein